MITRFKLTLGLVILILVSGCQNPFHPGMRYNQIQDIYPNTSPELVLQNLELAYCQKNLSLYKQCLLDPAISPDGIGFRFELIAAEVEEINAGNDVDNDGITDNWWGFQREIEYVTNLFQDGSSDQVYPPPNQISLKLQIPDSGQWTMDNQIGHEGWIIIACPFNLSLMYQNGSSLNANGYARFYLRPIVDEQGIKHWYIAIWRDESQI